MPTPTPRTHALQVAQSLDDYLDARGRWKMLATGKLAYVSEATAESVGKARVALVEALEAAIAQPSGNAG